MQDFWNNKARTYPAFEKNARDTLQILDFFARRRVDFSGDVLDIGCGTGRFSLQIALIAKSVLGVDFSASMLEKFRQSVRELELANVQTRNASWAEFCAGDSRVFDVVFAAMTPALDDVASVREVARRTRRHFCYVGWGESRNDIYTEVYAIHGVQKECVVTHTRFAQIAGEAGFALVASEPYLRRKCYTATPSEALADFVAQVARQGVRPDERKLAEFVARHTEMVSPDDPALKLAAKYGGAPRKIFCDEVGGVGGGENGGENCGANFGTGGAGRANSNLGENSARNLSENQGGAGKNPAAAPANLAEKIPLFRFPYERVNVATLFEKI